MSEFVDWILALAEGVPGVIVGAFVVLAVGLIVLRVRQRRIEARQAESKAKRLRDMGT